MYENVIAYYLSFPQLHDRVSRSVVLLLCIAIPEKRATNL